MTEAEWLAAEEPKPLIEFLKEHFSSLEGPDVDESPTLWWPGRKLRLWAVACCRRVGQLLTDKRSRAGLDALERYVAGELGEKEFRAVSLAAAKATRDLEAASAPGSEYNAACAVHSAMDNLVDEFTDTEVAAEWIVSSVGSEVPHEPAMINRYIAVCTAERCAQADLLREVFGNPFRPVALDPAWLTSDVRALAHAIYAERAWDRMPILADALQEAGCDNEDVLAHCRSATAPHVRGCWVVDLLLGKGGPTVE